MAGLDVTARPRRREGVLDAVIDDEVVLLGPADSRYHGLDPIGSRVWSMLDGDRSVGEICDALAADFDVDVERCRADVLAFLEDLVANDLAAVG